MKKIISILLAVIMTFSVVVPAAAAQAIEDEGKLPVIYIAGKKNTPIYKVDENGEFLRDENGQLIEAADSRKPLGLSRAEYIKQAAAPVLEELGIALLTDNYDSYIDSLVDAVAPIYEEEVLDCNAEDKDSKIAWKFTDEKGSRHADGLTYYNFRYDWRYPAYESADELQKFVEYVKQREGVSKVNIFARCYGSNVAMAYIAKSEAGLYDTPFSVNNFACNTTPLAGYLPVGALLSGSIKFDADTIDRFVTYYMEDNVFFEDPMLEMVAVTTVSFLNWAKVLGWGTEQVETLYGKICKRLIPEIALVSYGRFASYWSMVGGQFYEKAKETVFCTDELKEEYKVFIEKIDKYYDLIGKIDENGQAGYEKILKRLSEKTDGNDMQTAVFAKYGFATVPLFEDSDLTGDTRGTVTELSLGAIGTKVGETFTKKELAVIQAMPDYDEKYLSPDNKIYAGTCLFPEKTWFSKNLHHDNLVEIDPIASEFFLADGDFTVDSDPRYPQFHEIKNGTFNPVTSEPDPKDDLWSNDQYVIIFRFVTMLLKVATAIINGEFDFDFDFGSINLD
ncbi:MAG: hypothetical protein ACI4GC_04095 [Acutalibacteraceae bacterium]